MRPDPPAGQNSSDDHPGDTHPTADFTVIRTDIYARLAHVVLEYELKPDLRPAKFGRQRWKGIRCADTGHGGPVESLHTGWRGDHQFGDASVPADRKLNSGASLAATQAGAFR